MSSLAHGQELNITTALAMAIIRMTRVVWLQALEYDQMA